MRYLLPLALVISGFSLAVSFATFYAQAHISDYCVPPIPLLIPVFSSLGVFVGLLVYYLLAPMGERKRKECFDLLLKLLTPEEAKFLMELLERGQVTQAELSRRIGKVRAHRVVEKFVRKGIIKKEEKGRTYTLSLRKPLGSKSHPL